LQKLKIIAFQSNFFILFYNRYRQFGTVQFKILERKLSFFIIYDYAIFVFQTQKQQNEKLEINITTKCDN